MPPCPASRKTARWRSPEVGTNSTHGPGSKYLESMARPDTTRRAAAVRASEPAAEDDGATTATAAAAVVRTVARASRRHLLSGRTVGLPAPRAASALAPPYGARRSRW